VYRARRRLASGAAADALVTDGRRNEGVEGGRAVLEGDNRVLGRLGLDLDLDPDLRLDLDLNLGLDSGDVDVNWQLELRVGHVLTRVGHVDHPLEPTVSAIGESLAEHTSFGGVPRERVLECKLRRLVAHSSERGGDDALAEAAHDGHEGLAQTGSTRNSALGHLGLGLDLAVDLVLHLDLDLRLVGDLGVDLRLDGANVAGAVHRLAEVVLSDILILRVVEGGDRRRETIGGRGGRGRMSSVLVLLVVRDRVVIITRATSNSGKLERLRLALLAASSRLRPPVAPSTMSSTASRSRARVVARLLLVKDRGDELLVLGE